MTDILVTIDTELSPARHSAGWSSERNLESSIFGKCRRGAYGIEREMDILERHGLKGVFFVDPFPGLLYGGDLIKRIIAPILTRGHEVQLHIHTEWLDYMDPAPVVARGRNIADFSLADQTLLIGLAADMLESAGAPSPIAFRAGNYGANDDTLRALATLGIRYDSSFNPAYVGQTCSIGLPLDQIASTWHCGVVEIPIAAVYALPGKLRHAQICALSRWEMCSAIRSAADHAQPHFAIVSHSFELLSRDRRKPNSVVIARFERMCKAIAANSNLRSAGFADISPLLDTPNLERLSANPLRTGLRMGAQIAQSLRYGRA